MKIINTSIPGGRNYITKTNNGTPAFVDSKLQILNRKTKDVNIKALKFTALEDSKISCKFINTAEYVVAEPNLEMSFDNITYEPFPKDFNIRINAGKSIYVRGHNPELFSTNSAQLKFNITQGKLQCSGNIMYLLDYTTEMTTIPSAYCFYNLFKDCTALVTAPELPATTLSNFCYMNMFEGCTGLTLVSNILPATLLTVGCYNSMFKGCSSLVAAPELPALGLAEFCYTYMFSGCTSLEEAPILPAPGLMENCYNYMFNGCSNLNYIKCLCTDPIEENTIDWVDGVNATGTFERVDNSEWTVGDSGVPEGWEVIPPLPEPPLVEYVDLGLPSGKLWAKYLLGMSGETDIENALYFQWGDTEGHISADTSITYDWANYKWCSGTSTTLSKYNNDSSYGDVDDKTILDQEDDAVHAKLGGDWRMPTEADFKELTSNTTQSVETIDGVNGMLFTSTADTSKSLFVPFLGYRYGSNVSSVGDNVNLWSSSLDVSYPDGAVGLDASSSGDANVSSSSRYYGYGVLGVLESAK